MKKSYDGWHNNTARSRIEPKLPLTKREDDCMQLVCLGKSSKEIAKELSIGTSTLHTNLHIIYQRLNVKNKVQAVVAYVLDKNVLAANQ